MKRRANGEGTIYELTDDPRRTKRFRAEKYVTLPNGQQRRIVALGVSRPDAWAALERKAIAAREANPDAARLRVRTYLETWMRHKTQSVRRTTIDTYQKDIDLHILPALGDMYLQRVRAGHVQELLTSLQTAGKHATADKVRRTLKQAFGQAVRWEYLARNPVDRLEPVRKQPVERGMWQPAEIERFLVAIAEHPYRGVFTLAILTGLRQGELLGLKWADVGTDRVQVRRTMTEHGEAPPKTKAGARLVPLTADAAAVLGARGAPRDFVFRSRAGGTITPSNLTRALRTLCKHHGLPMIRFHDLRRVYATLLARKGAHPRVIQAMLGHSTPGLAMTVYTDVMQDQVERAGLALEDISGGSSGGNRADTPTGHD